MARMSCVESELTQELSAPNQGLLDAGGRPDGPDGATEEVVTAKPRVGHGCDLAPGAGVCQGGRGPLFDRGRDHPWSLCSSPLWTTGRSTPPPAMNALSRSSASAGTLGRSG